jgi:hypothetical protein
MSDDAGKRSAWTLVATGPGGKEIFQTVLRVGVPVTIGRAPESTVMLGLISVARNHGRIELVNGVPHYFNEPGAVGALVDGDPVETSTLLGERVLLEIGPFHFTLQRARPAVAPKPAEAPPAWSGPATGSGGTMLDRHLQGLRMHQSEVAKETVTRSAKWEQGWKDVLAQSREMQAHYGRHPRIMEFGVSKDEREVTIKLKEDSRRGYAYFSLSRMHPEGKFPELHAVWLRELGREDQSFGEPMQGLEELISRVAPRLL